VTAFGPVGGYAKQLAARFPAEGQRDPTVIDMRKLRELLTAVGGDLNELARWVTAVRETDDDAAALVAFDAAREFAAAAEAGRQRRTELVKELAQGQAQYRRTIAELVAEKIGRPGRPRVSGYAEIDREILIEADRRFMRSRRAPETIIREVVTERAAAGVVIGASVNAAVRRVFALIRPTVISARGNRARLSSAEFFYLPIAYGVSGRKRGVRKIGRPAGV
jgi:hypothetical protein